ncbi:hypothetical protein OTU49_002275 [Cherax quadricarinatus]|uniref:WWE domain-containing protein n=1 Tax=Cherax quadricarinatus TaxID=27406 RepID=A0AAW0YMW3_CHEQU
MLEEDVYYTSTKEEDTEEEEEDTTATARNLKVRNDNSKWSGRGNLTTPHGLSVTTWDCWVKHNNWQPSSENYHQPVPRCSTRVTPHLLVTTLAEFPYLSATLQELEEEKLLEPLSVQEIISQHEDIFSFNGNVVQLTPCVSICSAHSGPVGCQVSSCNNVHICPKYVKDWCSDKSCPLGHNWHTSRNMRVLSRLYLEMLTFVTLKKLFRSTCRKALNGVEGQLDVCRGYNEGGCGQSDCGALHVCLSFLKGLKGCSDDVCQLNHNLLSPDCCQLLKAHGFSTNEAPRDIVMALFSTNPTFAGLAKDLQPITALKNTHDRVMEEDQCDPLWSLSEDCSWNKNEEDGVEYYSEDEDKWGARKTENWRECVPSKPGQSQQSQSYCGGSEDTEEKNWRQNSRQDKSPRYNWSTVFNRKYQTQCDENVYSVKLTPRLLVDYLVGYPKFSASLSELIKDKGLHLLKLQEVVLQNKRIFNLNNSLVQLKPQVNICEAHSSPDGCHKDFPCSDLHICPGYVTGSCQENMCSLGHKWSVNHNKTILQALFIDWLPSRILMKLIRLNMKSSHACQLGVCRGYNEGGCSQSDCEALHICLSFVLGFTRCSIENCQLNHDLLSPKCCQLLKTNGFSTNETLRDIVIALLSANPTLTKDEQSNSGQNKNDKTIKHPLKIKTCEKEIHKYSMNVEKKTMIQNVGKKSADMKANVEDFKNEVRLYSNESKVKSDILTNTEHGSKTSEMYNIPSKAEIHKCSLNVENKTVIQNGGKKTVDMKANVEDFKNEVRLYSNESKVKSDILTNTEHGSKTSDIQAKLTLCMPADSTKTIAVKNFRTTRWSHDLRGDVSIPEICYYSVEKKCMYEKSGCQRLHSKQHFYWQVSKQRSHWMNLHLSQVISLERAYCDPSQAGVNLPCLDSGNLEVPFMALNILLGRDILYADFKAMNLTNSSKTKILYIRRLCTEAVSDQIIKASCYTWYFLDNYNKWIPYGKVDTSGETKFISNITSDYIEKHYLQSPSGSFAFKNSKFSYILDLNKMLQINQMTKNSRQVIRRPEMHLDRIKGSQNKPKDSRSQTRYDSYFCPQQIQTYNSGSCSANNNDDTLTSREEQTRMARPVKPSKPEWLKQTSRPKIDNSNAMTSSTQLINMFHVTGGIQQTKRLDTMTSRPLYTRTGNTYENSLIKEYIE